MPSSFFNKKQNISKFNIGFFLQIIYITCQNCLLQMTLSNLEIKHSMVYNPIISKPIISLTITIVELWLPTTSCRDGKRWKRLIGRPCGRVFEIDNHSEGE